MDWQLNQRKWIVWPGLVLLLAFGSTSGAEAAMVDQVRRFAIDSDHSLVGFEVELAGGLTTVRGSFPDFEGEILLDPARPEAASVRVAIQAASVDTGNERRDAHLRDSDFFEVESWPVIEFVSEEVEASPGGGVLSGTLTMKGRDHLVRFPFERLHEGAVAVVLGTPTVGFAARVRVSRTAFGLDANARWNRPLEAAGAMMMSDSVDIVLNVIAEERPEDELATGEPQVVQIEAPDGHMLAGTAWPGDAGSPGILLLHQCDLDRTMYDDLGPRLADLGFHVLTFSLRGIGESASAAFNRDEQRGPDFWPRAEEKFPGDVDAAMSTLRRIENVDVSRLGVLGASCMGREVIRLLTSANDAGLIRATGFLSSRLDEPRVRQLTPLGDEVPMLWIASEGDPRAASAARTAEEFDGHPRSVVRIYPGNEHGAPLFRAHPELEEDIARWFEVVLRRDEAP